MTGHPAPDSPFSTGLKVFVALVSIAAAVVWGKVALDALMSVRLAEFLAARPW